MRDRVVSSGSLVGRCKAGSIIDDIVMRWKLRYLDRHFGRVHRGIFVLIWIRPKRGRCLVDGSGSSADQHMLFQRIRIEELQITSSAFQV